MKTNNKHLFNFLSATVLLLISSTVFAQHKGKIAKPDFCNSEIPISNPSCGKTPTAIFDKNNNLNIVFVEGESIKFSISEDLGKTFSKSVNVTTVPEKIYADGENRPKIALGIDGQIYVSWVHKTKGRYTGDIRFSRSIDGGKSFTTPITVNDDGLLTSHRFDSMAVGSDGRIHLTWLDKRDLLAAKKRGEKYLGAAIYYAVSEDNGVTFSKNKKVADHSCECCRISLDFDSNNHLIALWRHVFKGEVRDHAISNLDEPASGSAPTRVTFDNWKIDACPHHGPDMTIDAEDRIHMFWFTGLSEKGGLFYGRFDQKTKTLEQRLNITSSAAASRPQILILNKRILLSWKEFEEKLTKLKLKISTDGGKNWSETETISTTNGYSDHPLLFSHENNAYISWWTSNEGFRLITLTKNNSAKNIDINLKPFIDTSLAQIEAANKNTDFFLIFWSVECPPCFRELEILAKNYRNKNFPKIIIVTTDGPESLVEVKSALTSYGLEKVENWYFDDVTEYLRMVIDPSWFGEIPRTYFYSEDGSRTSHSGIMTQDLLDTLLDFQS